MLDQTAINAALDRQSQLTKPTGSLGRLETLAIWLAGCQGQAIPTLDDVQCVLFAADHGIAQRGVSAFPQEVTAQMAMNFLTGGAASSVLARANGCTLKVIDMGIASGPLSMIPKAKSTWIAAGTADFVERPAMSPQQCQQAMETGRQLALNANADLLIAGEMGIANTSSASAIAARLLGGTLEAWVGRGTGVDDNTLAAKEAAVSQALDRSPVNAPIDVLTEFGGFEIVAMVGFYLGCCESKTPFLVDGWISSVAALVATRLNPDVALYFEIAHSSAERGHRALCDTLDKAPLLSLDMRLGEASGALVALSTLRMACALHGEMATFAEASVSGKAL